MVSWSGVLHDHDHSATRKGGTTLRPENLYIDTISEKTANNGVVIDGVKCKDSQVYTDQINEKTSGAGVTVDGLLIKDGDIPSLVRKSWFVGRLI